MRVTKFAPPKTDTDTFGLSEIDMPRLGPVVVLAGPNGAGKTRLLSLLKESLEVLKGSYATDDDATEAAIRMHEALAEDPKHSDAYREIYRNTLARMKRIAGLRQGVQLSGMAQGLCVAEFAHPRATLGQQAVSPAHRATQVAQIRKEVGTAKVDAWLVSYIEHVAERYWNSTHPETHASDSERSDDASAWHSLRGAISALLPGSSPGRNSDGQVILFGKPISEAGLSDGQKALLVSGVALHLQSARLEEAIVILDEPENHLHPDALIEYIDSLRRAASKGQVWIATHSIHVLSHVDPSAIWFVDGGAVRWSGRNPEAVLRRLVGGEERVAQVERFLGLPALYALERFTSECLLPPSIVSTGSEDPQSRQIAAIIQPGASARCVRVLDYGAGKGRILSTLRERLGDSFATNIDYRALEIVDLARSECVQAVAEAYQGSADVAAKRVYSSNADLDANMNPDSVDVVVLCNALHEIPVKQWRRLFTDVLARVLRPDGYLLVVEDMHIPYGEHAHEHGFLLLDAAHLKTLFKVNREDPGEFRTFGDDRLKAHLVRADVLKRVSPESVTEALRELSQSAREKVSELRGETATYASGRLLALYALLHVNATLALSERE